jgi:hypothetical protein
MTRQKGQKEQKLADWCTAKEAAEIISANSNHRVSADYIRKLGNEQKLETFNVSERIKLYRRSQVEQYQVRQHFPREEKKVD